MQTDCITEFAKESKEVRIRADEQKLIQLEVENAWFAVYRRHDRRRNKFFDGINASLDDEAPCLVQSDRSNDFLVFSSVERAYAMA